MNPYYVMAAVFIVLAGLMAVDLALVNAGLLPAFAEMRWLRVHFITLGIATELLFGLLPSMVGRAGAQRSPSWITFLLLNSGILALLVGIPSINEAVVYAGGALVLGAAISLIGELREGSTPRGAPEAPSGRWFYVTGLVFFLFGVTVGTGLLFGWAVPLRIKVPIEVHVHANSWGLMSLVFAGLVVDLVPRWSGRPLAWPGAVRPIYWLMTLGAAGLVAGPWIGSKLVTAPGLILHVTSTVWLLAMVVTSVRGTQLAREPGIWHIVTAYAWILAPLFFAPMVMLEVEGFPGADVEANAPQALVYGWILQVAIALLPFALRRGLHPGEPGRLGGSWVSLLALHGGGFLLWLGIFVEQRGLLHGAAYTLWTLAIGLAAIEAWAIIRQASEPKATGERSATAAAALAAGRRGGA